MDLKQQISDRGLKLKWVAEKINCNYSSFKVYINNPDIMPEKIEKGVKLLLKIK